MAPVASAAPVSTAPVSASSATSATRPAGLSLAPAGREPEPQRAASAGLSLAPAGAGAATSTPLGTQSTRPVRAVEPASLPFPAPGIRDVRELGDEKPVLRLNARQSAIGSLIVSGVEFAVWENVDGVTGSATESGETEGTPVRTSGNRPLVGFDDSDALVALRHSGELRRALFIGRGPGTLGVQTFDGSTVTIDAGDETRMYVLYLLRVAHEVELRAEPVDRAASNSDILRQFGFELTPYVAPRETRSR